MTIAVVTARGAACVAVRVRAGRKVAGRLSVHPFVPARWLDRGVVCRRRLAGAGMVSGRGVEGCRASLFPLSLVSGRGVEGCGGVWGVWRGVEGCRASLFPLSLVSGRGVEGCGGCGGVWRGCVGGGGVGVWRGVEGCGGCGGCGGLGVWRGVGRCGGVWGGVEGCGGVCGGCGGVQDIAVSFVSGQRQGCGGVWGVRRVWRGVEGCGGYGGVWRGAGHRCFLCLWPSATGVPVVELCNVASRSPRPAAEDPGYDWSAVPLW